MRLIGRCRKIRDMDDTLDSHPESFQKTGCDHEREKAGGQDSAGAFGLTVEET